MWKAKKDNDTDKQKTIEKNHQQKGKTMQFLPKYISAKEICETLRIHKSTLYAQIQKGKFPKQIKIGSCSRWERQAVLDWLEAQKGASVQ